MRCRSSYAQKLCQPVCGRAEVARVLIGQLLMTSTILAGLNGFAYTPPAMLLFKAGAQADV